MSEFDYDFEYFTRSNTYKISIEKDRNNNHTVKEAGRVCGAFMTREEALKKANRLYQHAMAEWN